MQPPVTIVAEMSDGTMLVEHVADFAAFVAVALPFRRDSECRRPTWHTTPALAAEELREAGCWPVVALQGEVA